MNDREKIDRIMQALQMREHTGAAAPGTETVIVNVVTGDERKALTTELVRLLTKDEPVTV